MTTLKNIKAKTKTFGISEGQYDAFCKALDYLAGMGKETPKDRHAHYKEWKHDKF